MCVILQWIYRPEPRSSSNPQISADITISECVSKSTALKYDVLRICYVPQYGGLIRHVRRIITEITKNCEWRWIINNIKIRQNLFGTQRTPITYMVIKTGCYRERLSCRDEETPVTWQFVIVAICDCVAICDLSQFVIKAMTTQTESNNTENVFWVLGRVPMFSFDKNLGGWVLTHFRVICHMCFI